MCTGVGTGAAPPFVGDSLGVGVSVGVSLGVAVGVSLGVSLGVAVGVSLAVGVAVGVWLGVGDDDGDFFTSRQALFVSELPSFVVTVTRAIRSPKSASSATVNVNESDLVVWAKSV